MASVRDRVITIVHDVCRPERPDLSDDKKPLLQLGLDSLDYASVLMAVEEVFGVSFVDDDLEKLGSVGQIVRFLEERGHP